MSERISNAALIPAIKPENEVKLLPCEPGGEPMTPDWFGSLIMMEVHIETATPEGTFASAVKVLDHCAELGVNGLWLTPIYEKGRGGNGYGNIGPHSVEPALTGVQDYAGGWLEVKKFVDEAHRRGIRILLDIITWGTVTSAPLFAEHPDWYKGQAWGNQAFDWSNEEFCDWFVDVCINNILVSGADGYRCDCEPNYTGYKIFNRIRKGCLEHGRKIAVIAEDGCERRDCFDCEQDGVLWYAKKDRGGQYVHPVKWYIDNLGGDRLDIVDSVKTGTGAGSAQLQAAGKNGFYRYYTFCVSNHDFQRSLINCDRLAIGYQATFAPFIPLWYLGGEFGMRAEDKVIYFVPVDWSLLDNTVCREFFEDVKRYIAIRRSYPEIFEYYPEDHRDSNICRVTARGSGISAYARYADGRAVIVIPNIGASDLYTMAEIPAECGISGAKKVTDLLTGKELEVRDGKFDVFVRGRRLGVYLAE